MITVTEMQLTRLDDPQPCGISNATIDAIIFCGKPALWAIDGTPVCYHDMQVMAGMNSDNEEFLMPVLQEVAA